MKNLPIPLKLATNGGGPKHICMHCRHKVNSNIGSVQWTNRAELVKHGVNVSLCQLHPEGRKQASSFNNNNLILCLLCCDVFPTTCMTCKAGVAMVCTSPESTAAPAVSLLINGKNGKQSKDGDTTMSLSMVLPVYIWDNTFIEQCQVNTMPGWKCSHQNMLFWPPYAGRVIAHKLKLKGNRIVLCKTAILEEDKVIYRHFNQHTKDRETQKKHLQKAKEHIDELVEDGQKAATALVLSKKVRCYDSSHILSAYLVSFIPSTQRTYLYRK
jgi:hypothetical protein